MTKYPLLEPVHDETFSSWATRCSLDPHVFLISDSDVVRWERSVAYELASNPYCLGMEFDFEGPYAKSLLGEAGLSQELCRKLFAPSDEPLLSPAYRTAFCPECILFDVVNKRFPSWRKSWCYITRPYCTKHGCLLRFMDGYRGSDKQWIAFTKLDLGEYMPGRMSGWSRAGHGVSPSVARNQLTLRVQTWVEGIYSSASRTPRFTGQLVDNNLMRTAIDLMLRLSLVHRTKRTQAGTAKIAFSCFSPPIDHTGFELHHRLRNGSPRSVPYERMCVLWLIGKVFRVYTASESILLHRMVHEAEFSLPATLGELGEIYGSGLLDGEAKILAELFTRLNVAQVLDGEFLEGLIGY